MIVKAAIMFSNGQTLEGHDYGHIINLANKLGFRGERIYGFVTSAGDFVLPGEAARDAVRSGQIANNIGVLTPEILWPELVLE